MLRQDIDENMANLIPSSLFFARKREPWHEVEKWQDVFICGCYIHTYIHILFVKAGWFAATLRLVGTCQKLNT